MTNLGKHFFEGGKNEIYSFAAFSTQNLTMCPPAANAGAQGAKLMPKATKMMPKASTMELTYLPNDRFGYQK